MKELYTKPEIDVIEFNEAEVLTTSLSIGFGNGDDD